MIQKKTKFLAIQFKYLGDAVFITPALLAIKNASPENEIHLLLPSEVAPLFSHLPWVKKVWILPRKRSRANLLKTLPIIKQLRLEKFDRSVDFGGNDRGAILSLMIGAKDRIASIEQSPTFLQKIAYTKTEKIIKMPASWVKRHLQLLESAWGINNKGSEQTEIASDPSLKDTAQSILEKHTVICHIGTSQEKKEWPIKKWYEFYQLATKAGYSIAFTAGPNEREQLLIKALKQLDENIFSLPSNLDLSLFLAILNQAELLISGDTGPLHFAAGLGKKVIGLFGVEDGVRHYAPIYAKNETIIGKPCTCTGELVHASVCKSLSPCMNSISAEQVFELLKERYPLKES
ncbi:MAG: glycosyltransferase family 9 protein [Methylophilaceae bacterium]